MVEAEQLYGSSGVSLVDASSFAAPAVCSSVFWFVSPLPVSSLCAVFFYFQA
jgi:hypothetical protein